MTTLTKDEILKLARECGFAVYHPDELIMPTFEQLQAFATKIESRQAEKLDDIERYRMQMAGISTAAIGYWKEGDGIHTDYDTPALHDVAKLYEKYAELYGMKEKLKTVLESLEGANNQLDKLWVSHHANSTDYVMENCSDAIAILKGMV